MHIGIAHRYILVFFRLTHKEGSLGKISDHNSDHDWILLICYPFSKQFGEIQGLVLKI